MKNFAKYFCLLLLNFCQSYHTPFSAIYTAYPKKFISVRKIKKAAIYLLYENTNFLNPFTFRC